MFLLASLTRFVSAAEDLVAARLFDSERRRANDFLQGDRDCVKTDYTWTQGWAAYAGTMSFTAPEAAEAFTYVLSVTDTAIAADKAITGIWWPSSDGPAATNLDVDGDVWALDPIDADFDNVISLHHYINLGSGAKWDDKLPEPPTDVDLYFCYTPTPAPTPAPTNDPTPAPTHAIAITYGKLLLDSTEHLVETVTNIAAFLAQSSWESAKFTACDENNHSGRVNASCTQRGDGALYQDVNTGPHACALNSSMNQTAETYASWTTGPLQCTSGTETENCCWWGRGAIQTTGPTNYGALQHDVLDKRAGNTLDLCADPELLCKQDDLKWTAAVYFWVTQVQQASCFVEGLLKYTDAYDLDAHAGDCDPFAEGVGGVVNNGGWNLHAHGNHVDANNQEVDSDGVDGRVPRFETYMATLKTHLAAYAADTDHSDDATPPECTGNAAVDFVLNAANLKTLTGVADSASKYTWSGLCTALKEFVASD